MGVLPQKAWILLANKTSANVNTAGNRGLVHTAASVCIAVEGDDFFV